MKKSIYFKGGFIGILIAFVFGTIASAFSVQQLETIEVKNDFVVGPGKTEIIINPGETSIKPLLVTNRQGSERRFTVEIEDFTSGENESEGLVKLLGVEKGPYSLKDYIKPEKTEFILQHGDRATIPITISIPEDATPGGLYGAIIVSDAPIDPLEIKRESEISGGIKLVSRIAALYFVRINGEVHEDGYLKSFESDKNTYKSGPVKFDYTYENTGSIYNNPYGVIEIKNLYGTTVDQISIQPYFVMPGVERKMSSVFDREFTMGRYKATIKLNRGYDNIVDEKTVTFWVLPIKMVAGILIGLFLLLVILRGIRNWFRKNFEYKGSKKNSGPRQE